MKYNIEIREIEPMRVAFIRYKGLVTEANKVFPNVFKSIRGKVNGAPFFNYLKMNSKTKFGDIELCVPTDMIPSGNGIEVKETNRVKAICVTHIGPYETMFNAYEIIDAYAAQNKLELMSEFREVFIKGPGMFLKGNPDKYITEIIFPIKEQ
ncbi:GyrI-like domain-containing protein [Eubacterium multiforme]|uniref:Effector-binding domain-containing protein n=1 Tax=Eubacterium multiforme TaxID=83339 RepID=A0ABT9UVG2_9FIRM|nr:GyrI-like domain-containing protein [Eubacterium multiforme]MDQ0150266.1 effector-binding domain-containing protein [Eubacterium multiforme]